MSRARSSEGFEWPVYAAVFILIGGSVTYRLVENYRSEDAGELHRVFRSRVRHRWYSPHGDISATADS